MVSVVLTLKGGAGASVRQEHFGNRRKTGSYWPTWQGMAQRSGGISSPWVCSPRETTRRAVTASSFLPGTHGSALTHDSAFTALCIGVA
ncbi:unnamed protein product [Closterium sp. Naga37s-1]|nr:unnamed protein product [Closterium sp. Naga37s-1]